MSTSGSTFKVLVIDDSNTIRRSAEIFLKQGGHEVLLAEDGFDALAKVNDFDPHLIFCDILMPRLDGYQTSAIIKRNARFSSTPIIMLSSKDGVFSTTILKSDSLTILKSGFTPTKINLRDSSLKSEYFLIIVL